MDGYTIKQLFLLCKEEIENGNGDKKVYISADDEGNGYHKLYYSFTSSPNDVKMLMESTSSRFDGKGENENNITILG